MLEKVKILIPHINVPDELILLLIEICTEEALNFTHLDEEKKEELSNIIVQMVVEKLNKRGNEGINSVSFSGISESINDDYSASIIRALTRMRKIRTV